MSQALYRKYRSKKLSDIVGQEHITKTLERALKSGKISHAYLFTGPKGVGKTSIARILAHEINQLPYTDESIHLDIIEIDAASNRRIDEIRDLREKVHIAPTSAKYKVYIIDEVHMLTKEAFNALLKTLEEPPAHVIFILATTEAHKLPDTIISRTQRFTFKPIDKQQAVEHLRLIAKEEDMELDDDSLSLLAEHGKGSFRDSISLLDQVGNSKKSLKVKDVEALIGIAPSKSINNLLEATLKADYPLIIDCLDELAGLGIAPVQTAKQLSKLVRDKLIYEPDGRQALLRSLLKNLLEVPVANDALASLEVALFTDMQPSPPEQPEAVAKPAPRQVPKSASEPVKVEKAELVEAKVTKPNIQADPPVVTISTTTDIADWWPKLLNEVKKHNNTLYGVIRMAQPRAEENTLYLDFAFGFHAKKVADTVTSEKLGRLLKEITGSTLNIVVQHTPKQTKADSTVDETPVSGQDNIQAITSVFGGAEVLEA